MNWKEEQMRNSLEETVLSLPSVANEVNKVKHYILTYINHMCYALILIAPFHSSKSQLSIRIYLKYWTTQ